MKQNYFDELKSACQNLNSISDEEILEVGKTFWIFGLPEYSSKGTVALKLGANLTMIVNEKDVVEVDKNEHWYFIKIKAGANIITKVEIISQMQAKTHDCNCKQNDANAPSQPVVVTKQRSAFDPASVCIPDCWVEYACTQYTDSKGFVREICSPYMRCNVCQWA